MKQFNLDEYLKNPNRELVTRSGRKVRIICTDRKDADYPIVTLILNEFSNGESTLYYTIEGKFYTDSTSSLDLFFAPEKHEGWAHIFRDATGNSYMGLQIFGSKEAAEKDGEKYNLYVTTVKIEWEE